MTTTRAWPSVSASDQTADVLLADGTIGLLRRVSAKDRDDVVSLHESLLVENVRLRFFTVSRLAAHEYVEHVVASCDEGSVLALGLWRHGRLLGVGTAEPVDARSAEIAFVVWTSITASASAPCSSSTWQPRPVRPASCASPPTYWQTTCRCCTSSRTPASS